MDFLISFLVGLIQNILVTLITEYIKSPSPLPSCSFSSQLKKRILASPFAGWIVFFVYGLFVSPIPPGLLEILAFLVSIICWIFLWFF